MTVAVNSRGMDVPAADYFLKELTSPTMSFCFIKESTHNFILDNVDSLQVFDANLDNQLKQSNTICI